MIKAHSRPPWCPLARGLHATGSNAVPDPSATLPEGAHQRGTGLRTWRYGKKPSRRTADLRALRCEACCEIAQDTFPAQAARNCRAHRAVATLLPCTCTTRRNRRQPTFPERPPDLSVPLAQPLHAPRSASTSSPRKLQPTGSMARRTHERIDELKTTGLKATVPCPKVTLIFRTRASVTSAPRTSTKNCSRSTQK